MLVHIAGAGAAGTAVGRALLEAGHALGAIASRTAERAAERCALLGAGRPWTLDALADADRPLDADGPALLLVAVPDRHLAVTADALARRRWPDASVALHLSGSAPVDVLATLRAQGCAVGGLHPLKSFVDPPDARPLADIVCAVEGDEPAAVVAETLAADAGGRPFRIAPGGRAAWHAGAAHACNHLVALVDQALDLLERAGLDRDAGRTALLPLLSGTVENLRRHPPGGALTGPVVRGDADVVARHLEALASAAPDVDRAYRALARRALRLAREHRGLPGELADRIEDRLSDGGHG